MVIAAQAPIAPIVYPIVVKIADVSGSASVTPSGQRSVFLRWPWPPSVVGVTPSVVSIPLVSFSGRQTRGPPAGCAPPTTASGQCLSVRPQADPDSLEVRVLLQRVDRLVTTEAGLLEATERAADVARIERVDPHDPGTDG